MMKKSAIMSMALAGLFLLSVAAEALGRFSLTLQVGLYLSSIGVEGSLDIN